jgi:ferrous iron transport protein A
MEECIMEKTVVNLTNKEEGQISSIQGGEGAVHKLEALGIRPGKKIVKVSSQIFRGPVIIGIDGRDIALGYGLAKKILVR